MIMSLQDGGEPRQLRGFWWWRERNAVEDMNITDKIYTSQGLEVSVS
jgi:hypothetical protein